MLALNSSQMEHIVVDGSHVAECWFHADYGACQLVRAATSITIFLCGSWLVFEILFDSYQYPGVIGGVLWIEAFFGSQTTVLYAGTLVFLTVQWIRTAVDWPYISLDTGRNLCPSTGGDDCSIPQRVSRFNHIVLCGDYCSVGEIFSTSLLCSSTSSVDFDVLQVLHFYWMKVSLGRSSLQTTNNTEQTPRVQPPQPNHVNDFHAFPPLHSAHLSPVHAFLDHLAAARVPVSHHHNVLPESGSCQETESRSHAFATGGGGAHGSDEGKPVMLPPEHAVMCTWIPLVSCRTGAPGPAGFNSICHVELYASH